LLSLFGRHRVEFSRLVFLKYTPRQRLQNGIYLVGASKLRSSGRVEQQLSSYLDYVNNVIVVNCCAAKVSSPTKLHGFEICWTATIAKIELR